MRRGLPLLLILFVFSHCQVTRVSRPPPRKLRAVERVFLDAVLTRGIEGGVASLSPASDGKRVIVGTLDGRVVVMDTSGVEPKAGWQKILDETDDVDDASAAVMVAWALDGRTVAVAHGHAGTMTVWDTRRNRIAFAPQQLGGPVRALTWSADGRRLAAAVGAKVILFRIVAADLTRQAVLEGHEGPITSLAFSPRGESLATGGADRSVRLWNPLTGKLAKTWAGQPDAILALGYSPDGKLLAIAADNDRIYLLDAATGKSTQTVIGFGPVNALAFAPDGATLATGGTLAKAAGEMDGVLVLWNLTTFRPAELQVEGEFREGLAKHREAVRAVSFSLDGRSLYYGTARELIVWKFASD